MDITQASKVNTQRVGMARKRGLARTSSGTNEGSAPNQRMTQMALREPAPTRRRDQRAILRGGSGSGDLGRGGCQP
eukprot:5814868-Prymnesium_polylepis.1